MLHLGETQVRHIE